MTETKTPYVTSEPATVVNGESKPVQHEAYQLFSDVFFSQWAKGRVKYGSDLMTHNGRDASNDAMQEACDLVAYIVQMRMERQDQEALIAQLKAQLKTALETINNEH